MPNWRARSRVSQQTPIRHFVGMAERRRAHALLLDAMTGIARTLSIRCMRDSQDDACAIIVKRQRGNTPQVKQIAICLSPPPHALLYCLPALTSHMVTTNSFPQALPGRCAPYLRRRGRAASFSHRTQKQATLFRDEGHFVIGPFLFSATRRRRGSAGLSLLLRHWSSAYRRSHHASYFSTGLDE